MEPFVKSLMLKDDIIIYKKTGMSGAGDKSYDPDTIKGYWTVSNKIIMSAQGEEILSTGYCIVDSPELDKLSEGDKIQPPKINKAMPILKIDFYKCMVPIMDYGILYI